METLEQVASFVASGKTGTLSGWMIVALMLIAWWKGIPTLIEAWEKRSGGIEQRLNDAMLAYTERMDSQLAEADRQHKTCIAEQEVLRERISAQDGIIATQNKTIASQTQTIVQMAEQMKGLHVSNLQQQIALRETLKTSSSGVSNDG